MVIIIRKDLLVMSRKLKINKGVVLFLILIIGIISYLVGLSVIRSKDENSIKNFCTSYVSLEAELYMLPEKYRTGSTDISAKELESCIKDMKDTIKLYFVDNENAYSYLIQSLELSLTKQAGGSDVLTMFNKSITDFKIVEYRNDFVDVQITSRMSYAFESDTAATNSGSFTVNDNMTVQKIDGKWKIVYSNLFNPFNSY